jgi:ElaB/YqjD/DUF883 family membrane-anchored ribosome-binding protein
MSGTERDIERAKAEALRARARLAKTMSEIQDRLHPRTLINDALQEVRDRGHELADQAVDLARARPVATSAIAAAIVALFAREPIWKALATLIFHRRETSTGDKGLKAVDDPAPTVSGETPHPFEEVA